MLRGNILSPEIQLIPVSMIDKINCKVSSKVLRCAQFKILFLYMKYILVFLVPVQKF